MGFCDKVLAYADGLERASWAADSMRQDAILRNLELIGEAASRVPSEIRDQTADVPWRLMIALRNRLIHGYLGLDEDILWSVVCEDIPPLRQALEQLLERRVD